MRGAPLPLEQDRHMGPPRDWPRRQVITIMEVEVEGYYLKSAETLNRQVVSKPSCCVVLLLKCLSIEWNSSVYSTASLNFILIISYSSW